ncbi:hypothetical protein JXO59_16920 [candidate division KSB1 bacterium]|nr:hypothetical protein [candidate division KSB1 bacterium]
MFIYKNYKIVCCLILLGMGLPAISFATDHSRPVLEPYQLTGKRLVFTNWFYVRPGHFDWLDDEGKSVYTKKDVRLDERSAHFVSYDSPYGIRLFTRPAERDIPILATDKPWDIWGIRPATLIRENSRYRLWGLCNSDNLHTRRCYFESDDGIHWQKPVLRLDEFEGSRLNNLLPTDIGLSIFVDSTGTKEERYKSVWHVWMSQQEFEKYRHKRPVSMYALELDAPAVHVIKGAVSPDGYHWTKLTDPIAFEHGDTQSIGYYDVRLNKYVLFTRSFMVGSRAMNIPYPKDKFHQHVSRRAIARMESDTFSQFPLSEIIIETESDMHPSDQFYTNCYTTIPFAPDHHLMFPTLYNVADDQTEVLLYSSYNGKTWHRVPGPAVLPRQPFGGPDGGCFFAHPNLVERANGDWILPYEGYNVPHKYPRGAYRFEPGMMVWKKGRLVGIEAAEVGEFATVAFLLPGRRLLVNALTERAGYVKIEVVALNGTAIKGYTFADADAIIGDQYRTPVTWKGKAELDVPPGTPVWLRFRMKMARIFFLDFE